MERISGFPRDVAGAGIGSGRPLKTGRLPDADTLRVVK